MSNSTKLDAVTLATLNNSAAVLFQLQPTVKAQRQFISRLEHICEYKIYRLTIYSPGYLTRLEKLSKLKKLTSTEKYNLAGIVRRVNGYLGHFSAVALSEDFTEVKINLFCKNLLVPPGDNVSLCENLCSIITLQQNKILSERLQLLI